MQQHSFWLDATDHTRLYVYAWLPDDEPRAVLMLAHGMAEHAGRYARLGAALSEAGIALYAHDQRGHGKTAAQGTLGHFAQQQGWSKVVGDLATLAQTIDERHPQLPLFLLGHSMGSYIAQAWLMHHGASLQGAILSGSNYQPAALYRAARLIARLERLRQGKQGRSALIDRLSFGTFNKRFKPARTRFDWLSRDPLEVDNYLRDPLCGFHCTNQLWMDLLGGLQKISKPTALAQIDPGLPLLIIGGGCDPVSDGKRLKHLTHALSEVGHSALRLKLYPDARHELFNETNRDEVTRDLLEWLNFALEQPRPHRAE
ncbi:alpha/beta hydrolase [Pseudomonas sp. 21LCFQ02]|uniref:alpha/beta hydrolase n=1 Tax=unclassified Pseudomonas TaxID=196821 RepID=UPI0004F92B7F|nr:MULTISPECIES: alpha/beta hydrolase [unclassified Pseudomonas]MCO8166377.1 alpha/beta hydrolase [Pseudomonas sp. 21LCFQ02]BAP43796.1 alpha/beta fold family hydrolase [Pseudomonas sp. StFLB209]